MYFCGGFDMMMLITPEDFAKLSLTCRQELLEFFTSYEALSPYDDMSLTEEVGYFDGAHDECADGLLESRGAIQGAPRADGSRKTARKSEKKIVTIDLDQAFQLIKNISPRSKRVLGRFVSGKWVSISDLVGPDLEYRDLVELKRSLVGGVNRRLRTVIQDRAAVLFLANQDKSQIRISPPSAESLRQVLLGPE